MIDQILIQRGKRYGFFEDNAYISQGLKETMRQSDNWAVKPSTVCEALDQIQCKIARILSGDDRYLDNWIDIIGYAQLVLNEIAPEDVDT